MLITTVAAETCALRHDGFSPVQHRERAAAEVLKAARAAARSCCPLRIASIAPEAAPKSCLFFALNTASISRRASSPRHVGRELIADVLHAAPAEPRVTRRVHDLPFFPALRRAPEGFHRADRRARDADDPADARGRDSRSLRG